MKSVDTVFSKIETDFTAFSNELTSTGGKTYNIYVKTVNYIDVDLHPIIYTISDDDVGIVKNLNCGFAQDVYDDLENSICDNFVPNLFELFLVLSLISILALVHMFISMSLTGRMRSAARPS